ncbi:MAG: NADP-dependent oxidoreductase [Candidatus Binatia bacterium]|nr:NADP-dependent oxidoreductase [Candidatus Binatia bacterium]
MNSRINRRWVLAKRPAGEPTGDCFELQEREVRDLDDGQILIEVRYLSLDPYMRGRMRDAKSYADPLRIGEVITGESVGVVVESKSDRWAIGDTLTAHQGWQSLIKVAGDSPALLPADTSLAPLSAWVGVVGMPGRTGYFGLQNVGKPRAGETLVVSAASGAVGSVVGQIGKILGLRVVGVAGGPEKCGYCVDELGFDACVDYKAGSLEDDLGAACPGGIDVYFENVGGPLTAAVARRLNPGARVPICGFVALYNSQEDPVTLETPFTVFGALETPPEHRFFLVGEWRDQWLDASHEIAGWIGSGKLKYRETIADGLENAPAAFRGMLTGKNFGKQLVRVAG